MTVENANAFLDELKANGPNAKLMSRIGKDFQPEHMQEALKAKGINHEELLKGASGGSADESEKAAKWYGITEVGITAGAAV